MSRNKILKIYVPFHNLLKFDVGFEIFMKENGRKTTRNSVGNKCEKDE